MSAVEYLHPGPERQVEVTPYDLRLDRADGAVVGMLSNSFPGSLEFLHAVEGELATRLAGATFRYYDKGDKVNVSIPLADDRVAGIAEECQAVVTAWGH